VRQGGMGARLAAGFCPVIHRPAHCNALCVVNTFASDCKGEAERKRKEIRSPTDQPAIFDASGQERAETA
jgi:hypothetical protein